jgi:hypothetical protein
VTLNSGFRKRVYNDADGDLVNLMRCVADENTRRKLLHILRWTPPSRQIFEEDHMERGTATLSASAEAMFAQLGHKVLLIGRAL